MEHSEQRVKPPSQIAEYTGAERRVGGAPACRRCRAAPKPPCLSCLPLCLHYSHLPLLLLLCPKLQTQWMPGTWEAAAWARSTLPPTSPAAPPWLSSWAAAWSLPRAASACGRGRGSLGCGVGWVMSGARSCQGPGVPAHLLSALPPYLCSPCPPHAMQRLHLEHLPHRVVGGWLAGLGGWLAGSDWCVLRPPFVHRPPPCNPDLPPTEPALLFPLAASFPPPPHCSLT